VFPRGSWKPAFPGLGVSCAVGLQSLSAARLFSSPSLQQAGVEYKVGLKLPLLWEEGGLGWGGDGGWGI